MGCLGGVGKGKRFFDTIIPFSAVWSLLDSRISRWALAQGWRGLEDHSRFAAKNRTLARGG
jgi:hypothetical protein